MSEAKKERAPRRSAEEIAADHERAAKVARRRGAMKALMETPGGRRAWNARREIECAMTEDAEPLNTKVLSHLEAALASIEDAIECLGGSALLAPASESEARP